MASIGAGRNAGGGMWAIVEDIGIMQLLTDLGGPLVSKALLPSTLVRLLRNHYPREFALKLGAKPNKVRAFWSGF